jgi:hypothetical protein
LNDKIKIALVVASTLIGAYGSVATVVDFIANGKLSTLWISLGFVFSAPPLTVLVMIGIRTADSIEWNRFRIVVLISAIIAVLAVISLLVVAIAARPSGGENLSSVAPSATTGGPVTPPATTEVPKRGPDSDCLPGAAAASVINLVGDSYPISAGPAAYNAAITANRKVEVEAAGELRGRVPDGKKVVALRWSDPQTTDSTPKHGAGDGYYRPIKTFAYSPGDHCWHQAPLESGYPGIKGITYRIYLALIDESRDGEFISKNMLGDDDLGQLGITRIAYFEIKTGSL